MSFRIGSFGARVLAAGLLLAGAGGRVPAAAQAGAALPGFEPVTFLFANSRILPETRSTLFRLVDWLRARPGQAVELHGYADPATEAAFHEAVALERAEAVKAFLVDQGVEPERVVVRAFGMRRPVAGNTFDGRRENRRVSFHLPAGVALAAATITDAAEPEPPLPAGGLDPSAGGWTLVLAEAPSYHEAEAMLRRYQHLGYPLDVLRGLSRERKAFYVGLGQFFVDGEVERVRQQLAGRIPGDAHAMPLTPGM